MVRHPASIGALLPKVVQKAGDAHQAIQSLQQAWTKLVGKDLAAHTKPARLRAGRLYIVTDEPGASFILSLEKPRLLERVQACLEHARPNTRGGRRARKARDVDAKTASPFVVDEIIVRAGDV